MARLDLAAAAAGPCSLRLDLGGGLLCEKSTTTQVSRNFFALDAGTCCSSSMAPTLFHMHHHVVASKPRAGCTLGNRVVGSSPELMIAGLKESRALGAQNRERWRQGRLKKADGGGGGHGSRVVYCEGVLGSDAGHRKEYNRVMKIFDVEDPRGSPGVLSKRGTYDVNMSWELLRQDVLYLDWKARQDVLAIVAAHDKVVEVLNPLARDLKSVDTLRSELADLQTQLSKAHAQVHLSEARVEHTLQKLGQMESLVNDKLLQNKGSDRVRRSPRPTSVMDEVVTEELEAHPVREPTASSSKGKLLDVSGPVAPYPAKLKNFWYPVAFSSDIDDKTMVPFDSFEEAWVIFRGKDGRPGCVRDQCAHRACPLSLGKVEEGRIQCPYHGWEYSTSGQCEKMPSTRQVYASLQSLPCIEEDGMVWIWPGSATPSTTLPSLNPPANYTIHAQIVMELPVEHGLLVENLLDLAHAPFTHTTTFAKGWKVPSFVKFKTPKTPIAALSGTWDPYPIAMEFQPPCMVLSTIGLEKPGKLDGSNVDLCATHLHQLHVCMPSTRGKTRLLYRMALDFAPFLKYVPFINNLWQHLANKVLGEDLRLVEGQQNRMQRGANVWNLPVAYDKLGVRYRKWRLAVESGEERLPFSSDQ